MKPLVSVIIPTYNHEAELMECLKSIAIQSYRPFEVIVVDDGSTDRTRERLRETRTWFDMEIVELGSNQGAAVARNRGKERSRGSLLLFVDADADLRPHAIERMATELATHPDADFVYSSFRFGWKLFRSRPFSADDLRKSPYIHTTSLLRREKFPGFDESLKKFQDWDLWLTIAERGGKGIWVPEELFSLKVRRQGMSRWLPSFFHRLPWQIIGWMPRELRNYRKWERIVKEKHQIE